jgi:hypothetical protein
VITLAPIASSVNSASRAATPTVLRFDNGLTTTTVDVGGRGNTRRTIRRIQ